MPRNHGSVAGGGASRAYDESSWVPLYFVFWLQQCEIYHTNVRV